MLVGIRSFSCRSVFMVLHYFHIWTQKKRVNFVIGLHAFGYGSVFYIQLVTNCNQLNYILLYHVGNPLIPAKVLQRYEV